MVIRITFRDIETILKNDLLLIYPYWNVNPFVGVPIKFKELSFNLSILECKYSYGFYGQIDEHSFNLSILECKLFITPTGFSIAISFNLSILECKLIGGA